MARMLFGGEAADIYLHEDDEGDLHSYGPLVAKFYDGFDESASPVLDLLATDETAISELAVSGVEGGTRRGQLSSFWGPDEVYEIWVSVNESPRQLLRPVNVGSSLVPMKQAIDDLLGEGDPNPFDTALVDILDVDGPAVAEAAEGSTLVKLSSGLYSSGSSPIPLSDIIWVAASDAPANFQGAPYVCDGVDDHVEINAALANGFGLKVGLSPGNFAISDPVRIAHNANPQTAMVSPRAKYLIGSGQSVSKLNVAPGVNAGVYIYDNVGAHIWDLTINIPDQRGIWAFRTGGAMVDYRSMVNGSIRRVTIAGPSAGTHATWAVSLKSVDNVLLEEVTVTGTKWGIEVVTESSEQRFGNITFRNCRVVIVGDGGQCYRTGNDAGELRQVTFDTCHAAATSPAQATTEGFRISALGGQTYGVQLVNCTSVGLLFGIHTSPNATDVDADFAFVEPRQGGWFAWAEGSASRFRVSEFRIPVSVTTVAVMFDQGVASMPNQYWHHTYTQAATAVGGTLGNGVVRRGVHEGLGSVSASLLRNPSQLIDRNNIDPVQIITTATLGTVAANFTAMETKLRHTLDGKVIQGWFRIRSTNALVPTSNNLTDVEIFTLNTAYRPTEHVYALWSTGTATGALIIFNTGVIRLVTGNQTITANQIFTFSFNYIRD
jgi:hypothetical protein